MKRIPKVAALCAVFLLSCFLFSPITYAVEETPEPHTPAIATTESAIPAEDGAEAAPTDGTDESEAGAAPPQESEAPQTNVDTPNGTGTVIETATEEDGREFYTITTPAGNVFYLIIDFSKQMENVYFLDAVTEKDLLALAEKADDNPADGAESIGILPGTETDEGGNTPEPAPTPQAEQEPEAQNDSLFSMVVIVVVVAGVGGAAFYFKIYRKRKQSNVQDEYEEEFDEDGAEYEMNGLDKGAGSEYEGNGYDEYEEDQADEAPPWDDEDGEDQTDEPGEDTEDQEAEEE